MCSNWRVGVQVRTAGAADFITLSEDDYTVDYVDRTCDSSKTSIQFDDSPPQPGAEVVIYYERAVHLDD